ncbi:MAG: Transcriptional regulator, LuxR family protein [Labilithrix sp.]|nr:Transcriptional regulator, LuxR family protein [Labilithrix sp.]
MREVSVRILHFTLDLARVAGVDERALVAGLPSVAADGEEQADWFDWDDLVAIIERLERMGGGAEGVRRAMREALPTAYPEFRAFAAVFVRPIPFFTFVMTRLMWTMYRHIGIETIDHLEDDRIHWIQTIPEPYRACEAFHRGTMATVELFPLHLDLPEARVEQATITPRRAEFTVQFPPGGSFAARGTRAVSSAASVLAVQLDEAFANIAQTLRMRPGAESAATSSNGLHTPGPPIETRAWADRLALSPRQRDVFALLVEGRANKDIAAALRCSERNVEFHVGRILRAARVSSRAELLVKVLGARA